jgi:hypothetical protein
MIDETQDRQPSVNMDNLIETVRTMDVQALTHCNAKEHLAAFYATLLHGFLQTATTVKIKASKETLVVGFLHSLFDQLAKEAIIDERVARKLKVSIYWGILCSE